MTEPSRRLAFPLRALRGRGASSEESDGELVRRLTRGEGAALEVLIARHGERVRTFLGHLLRDAAWADDLTQEVFVRLYESATRFDPSQDLVVWLLRIARNLAIDLRRREDVHRRVLERLGDGAAPAGGRSAVPEGPHARLELKELAEQLDGELCRLPEGFRSVFVLREVEGLRYDEIAAVMGLSEKTVSTRLHRARMHLRRRLARQLEREVER